MFFFSSRRRHTRSLCDWSSDVCSSDLKRAPRFRGPNAKPGSTFGQHDIEKGLLPNKNSITAEPLNKIFGMSGEVNSGRSEERRVGKEWRSGGATSHRKTKSKDEEPEVQ